MNEPFDVFYTGSELVGIFNTYASKGLSLTDSSNFEIISSPTNYSHPCTDIFDSSSDKFFYSITKEPFIGFDFKNKKVVVTGFTLHGISNPYPTSFALDVSNNKRTWRRIKTETFDLQSKIKHFPVLSTPSSRFVRIVGLSDNWHKPDEVYFGLYSVELFGIVKPASFFCMNTFRYNSRHHPFFMSLITFFVLFCFA